MPVHDDLGLRMKIYYEGIPKTKLMRRTPVAIRIDGKAFHTFTRGFQKPFDDILVKSMQETMKYLCENIQGCVLGYTQSDEITLVLSDYKKLTSEAWFDYEVQKMCSIAASMATMAFNRYFKEELMRWWNETSPKYTFGSEEWKAADNQLGIYAKAYKKGAMFDARVFNIPKEEVVNCIYWRQLDAARNSVQMVGQANFSHNQLHGKTCNMIQDMLFEQKGINWNDYPTMWKRGVCWTREKGLDYDMPMLRGDDRKYLEDLVHYVEEE